jgi:hypothetical protein
MRKRLNDLLTSPKDLMESWGHLSTGVLLFGAAYVILILVPATIWPAGSIIAIVILYLVLLLWCATSLAAGRGELWPYLPNRKASCLLLPLLLATQVLAFAAVYERRVKVKGIFITDHFTAAYRSFINLTTLSYSDVLDAVNGNRIAFWQIVTGLLLVTCALPLLVTRLSMFGGGGLKRIDFNGCTILLPDSEEALASITKNEFKWELPKGASVTASLNSSNAVEIYAKNICTAPPSWW